MEPRWILYSNFVLFVTILTAAIYSILLSVHNAQYMGDSPQETMSVEFAPTDPPAPHAPPAKYGRGLEAVDPSTLLEIKRHAQISALSSFCLECAKDLAPCLTKLESTMAPVLVRNMDILYTFSTYARAPWKGADGFIGFDNSTRHLIISFGGSTHASDWINDFKAWTVAYTARSQARVHAGVFDVYSSLRAEIMAKVREYANAKQVTRLSVTGHSLGGALSFLAAIDLAKEIATLPISIYTFGQPRVGNSELMSYARSMFQKRVSIYRMVNQFDAVPMLPPAVLGYDHVNSVVYNVGQERTVKCTLKDLSETQCKFKGWTNAGHIMYFWNFDDIRNACTSTK